MADPAQCVRGDGSVVNLSTATEEELRNCQFSAGAVLHIEDEIDSSPAPTPPIPQPPAQRKPDMQPQEPPAGAVPEPTQSQEAPAAPLPAQEEGTLVPESPAAPSAGEIGDLISQSGGGALGLVAALIAVVGGTAGFKLWTKISEQKHEQQMKKLDIEQANAGLQGTQPPPCQAAHQTLLADIKAVRAHLTEHDTRLAKVEKSSAGFDPTVDVGDLEERVEVLEKALRKKARTNGGE